MNLEPPNFAYGAILRYRFLPHNLFVTSSSSAPTPILFSWTLFLVSQWICYLVKNFFGEIICMWSPFALVIIFDSFSGFQFLLIFHIFFRIQESKILIEMLAIEAVVMSPIWASGQAIKRASEQFRQLKHCHQVGLLQSWHFPQILLLFFRQPQVSLNRGSLSVFRVFIQIRKLPCQKNCKYYMPIHFPSSVMTMIFMF